MIFSKQNFDTLLDFVKNQSIFSDLSFPELKQVAQALQLQEYAPGDYIFRENDLSQDLYLLKSGEADLVRLDSTTQQEFVATRVLQGGVFGEISFIDKEPRAYSVKVTKPTIIYKLPVDENNVSLTPIYDKIIVKSLEANLLKSRTTISNYIQNINKEIDIVQEQNRFGRFFVFFFTVYTLITVTEHYLVAWDVSEGLWLSLLVYSLLLFLPTLCYMLLTQTSLSDFGLSLKGIKPSLKQSALIASVGIVVIETLSYLIDRSLFYENLSLAYQHLFQWRTLTLILYAFSIEFTLRGGIQKSLEKFFSQWNGLQIVVLNALVIWPSQLYLDLQVSFINFLINLFLGFIFFKQKNLAGVILIHFLILIFFQQYG